MHRFKLAGSALALIFTVLFAFVAAPALAEASIQHPKLVAYGDVQKVVYPGRSIFEYKDDQGLSSTLPFSRQEEQNISISFANLVLDPAFENKSISSATETKPTEFTVTKDVLVSNGVEYIYIKATNSSVLTADTDYSITEELDVSSEPAVTNDYILLVTAKVSKTADNLASWVAQVRFLFVDSGATERFVYVKIYGESGNDGLDTANPGYCARGNDGVYRTVQVKIQTLLDAAGASWNLVKLTGIQYRIILKTGTTLDASTTMEAEFIHALVLPSKVYIDDPSYTNGLVVNGTSGAFTPSAGEIINVYGANCTKIVGVTIPWQATVEPEIETDADNLRMQYTWEWTMPKSPSDIGDTLTFSNTNLTLYGYKDGSAWDKLYLNGVDKLSSIASLKVDETTGYWTYGLASSLTEGNMYQVIARIQYTADEFDSLTEAPVFWTNPAAWILYKFWEIVIAIASFFGIGAAWAVRRKRALRTPKR